DQHLVVAKPRRWLPGKLGQRPGGSRGVGAPRALIHAVLQRAALGERPVVDLEAGHTAAGLAARARGPVGLGSAPGAAQAPAAEAQGLERRVVDLAARDQRPRAGATVLGVALAVVPERPPRQHEAASTIAELGLQALPEAAGEEVGGGVRVAD